MALPLSPNEIRERAAAFSHEWEGVTSERAEAQTFWNEFFEVFGRTRRRVARFEERVEQARQRWEQDSNKKKGGFIDLFWPGTLIAEHKSAGKDLDTAYKQALRYFDGLPDRDLPRYVVVSDFARIRLYDLEAKVQHEFPLKDLRSRIELFGFISGRTPHRFEEQGPVSIKAAMQMGKLHDALEEGGYEGHALEVLLVRLLFCLFAEDSSIFNQRDEFRDWILDCTEDDGSDFGSQLAHLFQILNTPEGKRHKDLDERVNSFPHVNGKLFEETLPIASFNSKMRDALLDCCALDWSGISPAIFGALFQSVMDDNARRAIGAHYTSEENILKVINSLFMNDLRIEFEGVKRNRTQLFQFHKKLAALKFFDPACGCGNFLVIAYRELRLLELDVLKATAAIAKTGHLEFDVKSLIQVDVNQFYGIEIEEFPAQIAQVALWLMDHQMNMRVTDEFGFYYRRLPLLHSATISNDNALLEDWNKVIPSDQVNYIFGNPPFIGGKYMEKDQRSDMERVCGDIPSYGLLDYVSAWYVRAVYYLKGDRRTEELLDGLGKHKKPKDRVKVAFVSTNSITQGEQVAVLWGWLLGQGVKIHFAHRAFQWTNEAPGVAGVHCVIVGFALFDAETKYLFDYQDAKGAPRESLVENINPYLVNAPDILIDRRSSPICKVPEIRFGNQPIDGGGFLFDQEEATAFLKKEPKAKKYIRRYVGSDELINNIPRYCLWLEGIKPQELRDLPAVIERVEAVRDFRLESRRPATRELAKFPTKFAFVSQPDGDYLAIPSVSSERRPYIPIGFFGPEVIASNLCLIIPGAEKYHFGILSSAMHMAWVRYVAGRLESRYRYSNQVVYNNYPWPEDLDERRASAVSSAAQNVLNARRMHSDSSLAALYDPISMPPELASAHVELDRAVDAAYGERKFSSDAERVTFLFDLYQTYTTLPLAKGKTKRAKRKTH